MERLDNADPPGHRHGRRSMGQTAASGCSGSGGSNASGSVVAASPAATTPSANPPDEVKAKTVGDNTRRSARAPPCSRMADVALPFAGPMDSPRSKLGQSSHPATNRKTTAATSRRRKWRRRYRKRRRVANRAFLVRLSFTVPLPHSRSDSPPRFSATSKNASYSRE